MDLCALRDGDTGAARAWKGDEIARPLTAAGVEQVKRVASTIAALNLGLDLVISSPFLRAHQTAEIVVSALKPAVAIQANGLAVVLWAATKCSILATSSLTLRSRPRRMTFWVTSAKHRS